MSKEARKLKSIEPTIAGVADAVQDLAGSIQDLTVAVQEGFAKTEQILDRHEQILIRHDGLLNGLLKGQDLLNERVGDIEHRLGETQNRVEDIADMIEGNYEPRLRHLEKARA